MPRNTASRCTGSLVSRAGRADRGAGWRRAALGATLGLAVAAAPVEAQQRPDYRRLTPALRGRIPTQVPEFPFAAFPIDTRPMFDSFLWQSFIALMWPSRPDSHGEPFRPDDPAVFQRGYVDGMQPAFLGWKTAYDLYPEDGSAPAPWDQPSPQSPCKDAVKRDRRPQLISTAKFGTVADELNQAFAGPLIDQTGLVTRYEVRFNQAEYEYVRTHELYNRASWPANGLPPIAFPASTPASQGAIEVKIAWRDLSRVPPQYRARFFTTEALTVQPETCKTTLPGGAGRIYDCACKPTVVGMVGFHIAHKVDRFPQWVWGTFEQVDNLGEDPTMPAGMKPSYYDGARANPADHPGYSYQPAPISATAATKSAARRPVNVTRLSQIPSTPTALPTTQINASFRALVAPTTWTRYWLIGSQWSSLPAAPAASPLQPPWASTDQQDFGCEDGTPATVGGMAFPACGVANVTMETYHQLDSCQNCHQGAQRSGADFSWTLAQRAYAAPAAPPPHRRFHR
jgi:hypothetical protein